MNDNSYTDSAPPPEAIDEEALRKRLVNRIAIAGVAIVALLGGLAVIDSLYVASPTAPSKTSAPALEIETTKPVEAIALSASAVAISSVAAPEPPRPEAVPTIKSEGEPEESSSPSIPVRNEKQAVAKVAEPRPAAAKPEPKSTAHTEISRPLTQAQAKLTAQTEPRFVLQMGVFKNVDNAQELLAKLKKSGIPAQIEARVQVGPFKTKAEADEARTKLTALGLDAGLLMATHH